MRNLFRQVYSIKRDEDFGSFISATAEQVEEFSLGGEGPNTDYPQWDMKGVPTSSWNEAVLDILTDRLMMELDNKRPPPFPKKTRPYWEAAIRKKFCRIKQEWSRAQPRRTNTGCIEDANEIEERRSMHMDKTLKRIRVRERRVRVRFSSWPMTGG